MERIISSHRFLFDLFPALRCDGWVLRAEYPFNSFCLKRNEGKSISFITEESGSCIIRPPGCTQKRLETAEGCSLLECSIFNGFQVFYFRLNCFCYRCFPVTLFELFVIPFSTVDNFCECWNVHPFLQFYRYFLFVLRLYFSEKTEKSRTQKGMETFRYPGFISVNNFPPLFILTHKERATYLNCRQNIKYSWKYARISSREAYLHFIIFKRLKIWSYFSARKSLRLFAVSRSKEFLLAITTSYATVQATGKIEANKKECRR